MRFYIGIFLSALSGWSLCAPAPDVVQDKKNSSNTTIKALSPFEAEQERLKKLLADKPAAYVDKVMDASTLPLDEGGDEKPPSEDTAGLRSYLVETRMGFANRITTSEGSGTAAEYGLRTAYRQETLNYGEFFFEADVRHSSGDDFVDISGPLAYAGVPTSERVTLSNYGLPITRNVFADTALGDIRTEVTDSLTRGYRLSLGSSTVRGMGTHIYSRDFDLRAGIGKRGNLLGGPYPGFEQTDGNLSWLGYSHRFPGNFNAGIQATQSSGTQNYAGIGWNTVLPSRFPANVTSVAAAVGYGQNLFNEGDSRIRLTLLQSRYAPDLSPSYGNIEALNAQGVFFETGWLSGSWKHEIGLYTAQPGLSFGEYTIPSDNRGGYWRADYSDVRLGWGFGLDYDQQNPDGEKNRRKGERIGASGNARYRLSVNDAIGGNISVWNTEYDSLGFYEASGLRSVNANAYYQTRFYDWGRSRFMLNVYQNNPLVTNGIAATGEEIQWEHDWITGKYETMRPEFTTTLGYAYDRSGEQTQTYPTAGLLFRHWLDAGWHVGGNLRYSSIHGNLSTSQGLSGSLYTETELSPEWHLGAVAYMNQATVDMNANPFFGPTFYRTDDMSAYVYLRWEAARGTGLQALGLRGADSAGGGSVRGIVFFDTNRDGERQSDEQGVPNVDVWLEGRYRLRTDTDGRFNFPVVATGSREVSVQPESIPLPWGPAQKSRQSVEVPLRDEVWVAIPVVKVSD